MNISNLQRLLNILGIHSTREDTPEGPPHAVMWSCTWRLLLNEHGTQVFEECGGPARTKQQARDECAKKLMMRCMDSPVIQGLLKSPRKRRVLQDGTESCCPQKRLKVDQPSIEASSQPQPSEHASQPQPRNAVSSVNELCQQNGWLVQWVILDELKAVGRFNCTLVVDGSPVSSGWGVNHKSAKQSAAEAALALLVPEPSGGPESSLAPVLMESLCEAKFKQCIQAANRSPGELELELLSRGTVLSGILMVGAQHASIWVE